MSRQRSQLIIHEWRYAIGDEWTTSVGDAREATEVSVRSTCPIREADVIASFVLALYSA